MERLEMTERLPLQVAPIVEAVVNSAVSRTGRAAYRRAATPMVAGRGQLRQQLSAAVPHVQIIDIWSGEQTARKDDDEIYMRM
jgi:hypothetical protein